MKYVKIALIILSTAFQLQAQTTHIVDNNANGIGDFTRLSDAIAAASAGDVILLVPSVTSYGDISLTSSGKQLTIAGGGANGGDAVTTLLGSISLNAGSAGNTNLDGFVLGGFVCKSIDINFVDNAKIKAVRTTEAISGTTPHIRIRSSENVELEYFSSGSVQLSSTPNIKVFHGHVIENGGAAVLDISDTINFVVSNTILSSPNSGSLNNGITWLNVDDDSNGQFAQVIVRGNNKVTRTVNFGANTDVVNSIFAMTYLNGTEQGGLAFSGGKSYQNNTFYQTGNYGRLTNNTTGSVLNYAATADEDGNILSNPSLDVTTYKLGESSTAKDSGSGNDLDGTVADRGVYGGLDPMPEDLANVGIGVSVVPTISKVRLSQPTAVTGGKVILKVTGKSKKN